MIISFSAGRFAGMAAESTTGEKRPHRWRLWHCEPPLRRSVHHTMRSFARRRLDDSYRAEGEENRRSGRKGRSKIGGERRASATCARGKGGRARAVRNGGEGRRALERSAPDLPAARVRETWRCGSRRGRRVVLL